MNRGLKLLLTVLALMLIVVPTIFGFMLFHSSKGAFKNSFSESDTRQSNLREKPVDATADPISILFLGIDDSSSRRENGQSAEQSRTDAMILSTLNPDTKKIRLLSIPRDTLSYIPEVNYFDKITHAHAYGGPKASMEAVEETLNVPVDYFIRIDMDAFVKTVDELGGIEYDVPYDLNEPNTSDQGRIKLKKGKQLLNGDEALAITRTRKQDSDLKRGERQMEVLKILFKKAQETQSLSKLDDIIEIVGKNAHHNLSYDETRSLIVTYLSGSATMKSQQLQGENELLDGIYYIKPDEDDLIKTSNLLRKDLGLSSIKKDDILMYRVIDAYGDVPPLAEIDDFLLDKTYRSSDDEATSSDVDFSNETQNEYPAYHDQQIEQSPYTDPGTTDNNLYEANVY
ncbi:LCP family protein [Staphylococcus sp. IVB6238]|uniref:LCP family protein n=1 Tax=unclassified Staphylococcus TaxID=91994 RepID=UPI0021D0EC5E|nr:MULTISPECIES: LCP family protein [unclassified Staphylococcus]UXR72224.1 LCP family protein [Staphylococcus sp. IVB6240]UXR74533.1 LCP family protein [Staphylococcus sp. IVB6238]